MKKIFIIIAVMIVFVLVGTFLLVRHYRMWQRATPQRTNVSSGDIQKMGEGSYRKGTYAPVIEVYRRMLAADPQNVEIKKMLSKAYRAAGDDAGAAEIDKGIDK